MMHCTYELGIICTYCPHTSLISSHHSVFLAKTGFLFIYLMVLGSPYSCLTTGTHYGSQYGSGKGGRLVTHESLVLTKTGLYRFPSASFRQMPYLTHCEVCLAYSCFARHSRVILQCCLQQPLSQQHQALNISSSYIAFSYSMNSS